MTALASTPPDKSLLQWMGPELARAGLVKNDDWVPVHCARDCAIYSVRTADGKRLATIEIGNGPRGWGHVISGRRLLQMKGPCNALVSGPARNAIEAFLALCNKPGGA